MTRESSLGRFIRACRSERGFTTRKVEELTRSRTGLVPISHSNLIAIEQGLHVPSFDKIVTLALVLNVPSQMFEDRLRMDMMLVEADTVARSRDELKLEAQQAVAAGHFDKALGLYTQLHAAVEAATLSATEQAADLAYARLQAADCRLRLGLPRVAKDELEGILKLEHLPAEYEARTYYMLAETCRQLGNRRLAMTHAREAVDRAREIGDPRLLAKVLNTMANVEDDGGQTRAALASYEEALALLEPLGEPAQSGRVLRNLGACWERLGDLERAAALSLRGVAAARAADDRFGLASGLANLARFHFLSRQHADAKAAAKEAKELAQAEGYNHVLFAALFYLWRLAEREPHAALARVYLERLKTLQRRVETRSEELVEFEQLTAPRRSTA